MVDEAVATLPQADHLHHLLHPARDQLPRHAVQLGVQAQVLLGGEVAVEGGVLEHQADVAAHLVAFADDVVAGHEGRAPGGAHERAEHVDRGRLACSVGAEEAERLPRLHGEVDAADGFDLAVLLGQPAHDHGAAGARRSGRRLVVAGCRGLVAQTSSAHRIGIAVAVGEDAVQLFACAH